jgi:transposase
MAADGVANQEIARRCQVDSDAVRRWRRRFIEQGPAGVGMIAKGRGRKPSLPRGTVAEVLRLTRHETPLDGSTHWTTRTMAARVGIGKDSVARIWADHNLKPWKVDTFKISTDPDFETKLVDVVGLYLNPPARAVVFQPRREDAVPSNGPNPAVAATETRPGRDDDPRLQTPRHH